jgi:hypothetical protein
MVRNSLKPRRLKLEFYDNDGVRHSVTVDGPVTREKIGKLLDLVEIMSGGPRMSSVAFGTSPHKYDRLASLIVTQLKHEEFTAAEAKKTFEESYGDRISLSTVATYLSRLAERGVVERGTERPHLHYRVKREEAERAQLLPLPRPSAPPSEQ